MTAPTHLWHGKYGVERNMQDFAPNLVLRNCTWSAGWCSAQRIKIPMIAGGNHTIIYITPPYIMHFLIRGAKLHFTVFPAEESDHYFIATSRKYRSTLRSRTTWVIFFFRSNPKFCFTISMYSLPVTDAVCSVKFRQELKVVAMS